jgi:Flp pilus assembly protein TadG
MIRRSNASKHHARNGTATVEFAVILPVYMLIFLGTIETCSMIFFKQSLEIAAYEGARVAIVPKTTITDIQESVDTLLTARRTRNYTVTVTPANYQNAAYGTMIRVEVSASCNDNSVIPLSIYSSRTFTGAVEMMKEY